MSESLDKFVNLLLRAGLLTETQLQAVRSQLVVAGQATETDDLAQRLAESGHLTEFQASEVRQGKIEHLVVGDYLILDPVGKGGMGQVFKARHAVMKREVAVKFVLANADGKVDPASLERFQREVEAASKLSHPNIVSSLDAGRRGEVCYLVMEYVRGMNLASYVRENGPMTFRHALDCILQAAQGLEYAHRKGFVHRDIKPSNLLMTTEGQVKVLDLGLVRMNAFEDQSRQQETEDQLTRSGQLLGTVDFMAPEQAIDASSTDGRADIYGLGCTLYYLLTGIPPFRREGNSAMGRIIAHREMPIPSICEARVDVPASFETIFQKMMAKQVGQRYQTVSELIADLKKAQVNLLANDETLSETQSLNSHNAGGPATSVGVVVAAIAVALLVMLGLYQANQGPTTQNNAAAPATGDAATGESHQPSELLSKIELPKFVLTGSGWKLEGGKLIVPEGMPSKLHVPVVFPAQFQLHVTVTRLSGIGPFVLGVSETGRSFYVLMDAPRPGGHLTALGTKGGSMMPEKDNTLELKQRTPVELLLTVGADSVSLAADGKTLLSWQGDLRELTLGGGWGMDGRLGLLVGSNNQSSFEISRLELVPVAAGTMQAAGDGSE